MRRLTSGPVRTFSIGFDRPEYDELAYARQVARHFETEHHELVVKPDALAVLPRLVLGNRAAASLAWSLVASGYSFTLGVLVAATAGVRGLQAAGPAPNWVVFVSYAVGTVGAILGVVLLIVGAAAALRGEPEG